jgi:hypothetical protein
MPGAGYPTAKGKSILEILWDRLIDTIDILETERGAGENGPSINRIRGLAEGIAWSIAVMTHSPRDPDIDAIKAEAMERWEEFHASRNEV